MTDAAHSNVRLTFGLTPRELEVLLLICDGLSSKQIGQRLGITRKTVEFHRAQISDKTETSNVAGLVRWAMREGLIVP